MAVLIMAFTLSACEPAADRVSHNISEDADNFKILRKVVFYNTITGEYIHVIEGYCSIYDDTVQDQLELTCKFGPDQYKKEFLKYSETVIYFALQIDNADVSAYHYKVYLRPQTLIPEIEVDVE